MRFYDGQCHCGRTRFRVFAEIDHVRDCDCSICSMRGALLFRVSVDQFELLTKLEELEVYIWGSGTGRDYFCKTCGILPFRRPSAPSASETRAGVEPFHGWSVNVRCLSGVDLSALPRKLIRGRDIQYDA